MRRDTGTDKSRGEKQSNAGHASLENALLNKNNNNVGRRETATAKMSSQNGGAPTLESTVMTPPKSPRKPKDRERKRIFVSGVNSLVG